MAELLMPAGNLKKLKTAFHFGADAVYLGGKTFSLRAFADNFTRDEIVEGIEYAHAIDKKVYVTVNIFAKNSDLDAAGEYFKFLENAHADAVIVSDAGLVSLCKSVAPRLAIHLSTQANTTNKYAVEFWARQGVSRIVLARELSLDEISEMHKYAPSVELEAFVHGAMCMSFSGRCLLSSYFSSRSANSGECVQPCRWSFKIVETKNHDGEPLFVEEDDRGSYFMNSKDLRLLARVPEFEKAGICSFKVEGRMKSEFYVATVARAYRRAMDELEKFGKIVNVEKYLQELETVSHREYTEAFADGRNDNTVSRELGLVAETEAFVGLILSFSDGRAVVEMRNRFKRGDELTLLSPNFDGRFTTGDMWQADGTFTDDAKLVQHNYTLSIPFEVRAGDILVKHIGL